MEIILRSWIDAHEIAKILVKSHKVWIETHPEDVERMLPRSIVHIEELVRPTKD